MQTTSSAAEGNHNGSISRPPPQQPVLYPVRLVYDAVVLNAGPEMQNQTLFVSPQPMQWTPYHTQPHFSLPVQGPTRSIPPWLQGHQYNQQYIRAPYGNSTQAPSYVLQNNMIPVAYATVNNTHAYPPNTGGAAPVNHIRQTVPMLNQNNYRVQTPHNLEANQTNLPGVTYNQARRHLDNPIIAHSMPRYVQVPNSSQFAGQQAMVSIGKTNLRPNQAALQIRKNQEINRVSQSTMTNTSYCQNRKPIKTQTVQTSQSRMPLSSNIVPSQTNTSNKTLLRPANVNVNYPRTVFNQSSTVIPMNPSIRQNIVKSESPSTTKVAIAVNPMIRDNIESVNPKSIAKENNVNHTIYENITSPPAFYSKETCHTEVNTRLEINETPAAENLVIKNQDKSFNENENSSSDDKKRKNSFKMEALKKMKWFEETGHKELTVMADLHAVKENNLNVKEEKEGSKANELTTLKQNNDKTIVDQNDSKDRSKIPTTTTNMILNHVIDGIVIQESKYPFKEELEENVSVENEKQLNQSTSSNGNEENKVVVGCNTDKQDVDLKPPRWYYILNHVIDGIVIQESDVPFAIRVPLREKSGSINGRAAKSVYNKNIQKNKSCNKKTKGNKGRIQSEKDNTKERDINVDEIQKNYEIKNDGDEIVTSILRNRLENEKDSKPEIVKSEKVEISTKDTTIEVSDTIVKESDHDRDDNEDVPKIGILESVDAERLKYWTCDELQMCLRAAAAWCPCFAALQHEEVDGRALLLAEERQLIEIGVHSAHARALCELARRSTEHN